MIYELLSQIAIVICITCLAHDDFSIFRTGRHEKSKKQKAR